MRLTLSALAMLLAVIPAEAEERVDLELVLAVDASGSVDANEFDLQMRGIAEAFRDPELHAAIGRGPLGRIAVSVVVWAASEVPPDRGPWHRIAMPAEAYAFAAHVEAVPRRVGGGTGIGNGLARSADSIDRNGFTGIHRVIDISGDGRETAPRDYVVMLPQARQVARARGITVNGLAILTDDDELDLYYRNEVVTGPGAFVISVGTLKDFAAAMRRKLIREIEGLPNLAHR